MIHEATFPHPLFCARINVPQGTPTPPTLALVAVMETTGRFSGSHNVQYDEHTTDVSRGTLAKSDAGDEYLQEISKDYRGADMEVYEREPSEPRRGISRHLTEEGALPICEQCNSNGQKGPVQISVDSDGSAGFRVSMVWAHKPFEEADCRNVYICHECFWAIQ